MYKIHGYIRGVHMRAMERRLDMQRQVYNIKRYAKTLMTDRSILTMGTIYQDVGTLRNRQEMTELPAGQELLKTAERYDHIILSDFARTFHWPKFFVKWAAIWKAQGITVHFAQKGLEMSLGSGDGEILLAILQALADKRELVKDQMILRKKWSRNSQLRERLI